MRADFARKINVLVAGLALLNVKLTLAELGLVLGQDA
jgi:hypothetical protein